MFVDPNEFLGRSIYFSGEWDPKVTWAIRRLVGSGDTVVDIGAHCGATALTAAGLVGNNGAVHAFEPQPVLAKMLRKSAALNEFSHLHVHEIALSSSDGMVALYIPNDGKVILAGLNPVPGYDTITIEKRHAGRFLEGLGTKSIALIKIDVEGHEIDVLNGAAEFISSRTPRAILFESIEREGPFRDRPPVRFLTDAGYVFYGLPKKFLRMNACKVGDTEPFGCHDFIAVHQSASDLIRLLD